MNIRSEIRLEIIRENMTFSCSIPGNTTHDMALSVIEEFKMGIEHMKKTAEDQKKNSENKQTE